MITTNQSAGAAHGDKHQLITSKANAAPMNNGSTTTTTTTSGVPLIPSNDSSQCYVARNGKPFDLTTHNLDTNLMYDKKMYSSYHHGNATMLTATSDSCSKQRQSTVA